MTEFPSPIEPKTADRPRCRGRLTLALLIGLSSTSASAATNGTWTDATTGGLWSDPANWSAGSVADGADGVADFSTLNITADNTVNLDNSRTIGSLLFGDVAPTNDWFLDNSGNTANSLMLSVASGIPTITVNNQFATINAAIAGTQGLLFSGSGTLALGGTNSYSGGSTLNSGATVIVQNNSALGAGAVTVTNGAELHMSGALTMPNALSISGGGVGGGALFAVAGNATYSGRITVLPGGAVIGTATNAYLVISGGIDTGNGNPLVFTGTGGVSVNTGAITGSGSLTSAGSVNPTLTSNSVTLSANSSYTGGTTISNGSSVFVTSSTGLGTGTVTVNDGAVLTLGPSVTIANPITIAGNGLPGSFTGALTTSDSATAGVKGPITLSGPATLGGAITYLSSSTINTNGYLLTLNSANAGGYAFITGSGGLNLTGGGYYSFRSASGYTGGTTINGATLAIVNASGSATGTGPVVLTAGGTLGAVGGNATVSGPVSTISTGSGSTNNGHLVAVGVGTSAGILNLNGGLALDSHSFLDYAFGSSVEPTGNLIAVTGDLTLGANGTLNITGSTLSPGAYKLITYTGAFSGTASGWAVGSNSDSPSHAYTFSTATPHEFDLIVADTSTPSTTSSWTGNNTPQSNNWMTASNWLGNVRPAPNNVLYFYGNSGINNNNDFPANTQFNGLRFDAKSSGFSITGNAINVGGDLVNIGTTVERQYLFLDLKLLQNTNFIGSFQVSGVVSGPFSVTTSGDCFFAGANTFTGGLFVLNGGLGVTSFNNAHTNGPLGNVGSVVLGGPNNQIGSIGANSGATNMPFILAAGGGGAFNGGTCTLTGLISGGGSLLVEGGGSYTLTASNTYTGGTTVFGGKLLAANSSGSATGSGPVTVSPFATLGGNGFIGGPVTVVAGGHLSPSAGGASTTLTIRNSLNLTTGSILDLALNTPNVTTPGTGGNDLISILGTTGANNGNLTIGTGLTINITSGTSFANGVYHLLRFNGALTDNSNGFSGWSQSGAGHSLTYSLSSAGNGVTYLDVTSFTRTGQALTWTGKLTTSGGQQAFWDTTGTTVAWAARSSSAAAYVNGDQATFLDTYNLGAGPLSVSRTNGSVDIQASGVFPGAVTFNNSSEAYVLFNASGAIGIGGPTGIAKLGTGSVELASPNSFTGQVFIRAGRINLQDSAGLGASAGVVVSPGAALELQAGQGGIKSVNAGTGVPLFLAGDGVSNHGALNNVSSTSSGTNTYSGPITIQSGGARIGSSTANQTLAITGGITTGSNPLTFSGAGNTTIKTNGLALGTSALLTSIGPGTLELDAASSLGDKSSLLVSGGRLRFNITTGMPTIGSSVTATVAAGGTMEFAGSVAAFNQSVNVTNNSVAAAGGLLVTGTNQRGGAIAGSGSIVINSGSDLAVSQLQQGPVTLNGTGKLTLRDAGSPLSNSITSIAGSGTVNLNSNNLTVGGAGDLSSNFSGAITGSGGLTKAGAGTFTLSGLATYSGSTVDTSGVLRVTSSLANNGSNAVYILAGTDFNLASLVRRVQPGGSYAGFGSTAAGFGLESSADIRAGRDGSATANDLAMQWRVGNASDKPRIIADVLNLSGMSSTVGGHVQADPFVLQMTYNTVALNGSETVLASSGLIDVAWLNTSVNQPNGLWQNATMGNFGIGLPGDVFQNVQSSWDAFAAANSITDANVGNFLGSYGVDVADHQVWAVVNHNSQFAVVPEPSALILLVIGGLVAAASSRRLREQDAPATKRRRTPTVENPPAFTDERECYERRSEQRVSGCHLSQRPHAQCLAGEAGRGFVAAAGL